MIDILLDLSMNAKINNTDQILAKYFLNQREKLIELSLEDVIYDTGLSKSSIIRFCKSIKTSHFTDFKKTFVREFNAVICDFIYLLDDRDKLDDLVIACNHCHQIILFGEREAMLIWKMYLKYFYVLGYDIYIINEEDNNLAINMDEHTLYFYSHLQISLEKYYDYNISNALIRNIYRHLNDENNYIISLKSSYTHKRFLEIHEQPGIKKKFELIKIIESLIARLNNKG